MSARWQARMSITLRMVLMFAAAALLVFTLMGLALHHYFSRALHAFPEEELRARASVLEPSLQRAADTAFWGRLSARLNTLHENDPRVRFWIDSSDPDYRYGDQTASAHALIGGPLGFHDLPLPEATRPWRARLSEVAATEHRPSLRFLIALDTESVNATQNMLIRTLIAFSALGVFLASISGYWIARIGLKPLVQLSNEARSLAPQRPTGRLQLSALPLELRTFASSFNAVLVRVEEAYGRLESFNANVAHELRTPLTNLIGETQVALTRARSVEDYSEMLQSNLEELERLRSIINDMLFLAGADQGRRATERVEVSLREEIARTIDYLDFVLEERRVVTEIRGDAPARIEKPLFHRALVNLIHNAAQHAYPGALVLVDIEQQQKHVRIGVSNAGLPLSSDDLPRVFERFYRADTARSNSGEHHGLGLAIVKAVALMHEGTVFAHSKDGVNTFGMLLPA